MTGRSHGKNLDPHLKLRDPEIASEVSQLNSSFHERQVWAWSSESMVQHCQLRGRPIMEVFEILATERDCRAKVVKLVSQLRSWWCTSRFRSSTNVLAECMAGKLLRNVIV